MAIIGNYVVVLKNACTDETCYWHASHWTGVYSSGCYKLRDATKCDPKKHYCTIEDGLKEEGRFFSRDQ